jgi:hypothetical protein
MQNDGDHPLLSVDLSVFAPGAALLGGEAAFVRTPAGAGGGPAARRAHRHLRRPGAGAARRFVRDVRLGDHLRIPRRGVSQAVAPSGRAAGARAHADGDAPGRSGFDGAAPRDRGEQRDLPPHRGHGGTPEGRSRVEAEPRKAFQEALGEWNEAIGDAGHLFGMQFSLVDAWLFSAIEWARLLGIEPPAELDRLNIWVKRIRARPSAELEMLGSRDSDPG